VPLKPWIALVTVWIVWGSTYLGIRAAVETIPPLLMAGTRFVVAGGLMFLIARVRLGRQWQPVTWPHLRSACIVGALLLTGGNGLVSAGETVLASGLAALIVATVPSWMVIMNAAVTRSRPARAVIVALVLGGVGVGVLMGGPGGDLDVGAAVLVLIASVLWAAGTIYARHAPLPGDLLLTTSLQMLAGGLLLLLFGAAIGELPEVSLAAISLRSAVGLAWIIFAGAMVGFTAYIYANSQLPSETVGTYAYVNPVVAVALGALIDREPVTLNVLLGGAIIVSSVVIIVRYRVRDKGRSVRAARAGSSASST
jgi:drug/metabolite transporter (DMT)-like permease